MLDSRCQEAPLANSCQEGTHTKVFGRYSYLVRYCNRSSSDCMKSAPFIALRTLLYLSSGSGSGSVTGTPMFPIVLAAYPPNHKGRLTVLLNSPALTRSCMTQSRCSADNTRISAFKYFCESWSLREHIIGLHRSSSMECGAIPRHTPPEFSTYNSCQYITPV